MVQPVLKRTRGSSGQRPAGTGGETGNCSITPTAMATPRGESGYYSRADPQLARSRYGGCLNTSARSVTKGRMSFRYGLVQARIKIPHARGIWQPSGCWVKTSTRPLAPMRRDRCLRALIGPAVIHGTVHGTGYSGREGITGSRTIGLSLGDNFHVYSVCWKPGRIAWYVNDRLYHAVTPADLPGKRWVFDHDFFLLVNVAVGGTASKYPDHSTAFPQTMLIDYIRIYEIS